MYKNLKILIIDVGHGGTDPGAVGNGIVEKVANLNTALALKAAAEAMGIMVFIIRSTDITQSLDYRVKYANDIARQYPGAQILFVSVHHNAGGGDRAEAIHSIYRGEGQRVANLITDELHHHLGQQKKVYEKVGSDNKDYYYVIKYTNMDAVIVEVAFLDNINDVQICDSVEEQQRNGQVIACAIGKFFGLIESCGEDVEAPKPTPPPIVNTPKPTPPVKQKVDVYCKVNNYPFVKNTQDYAGVYGVNCSTVTTYPIKGEVLCRVSPVNGNYYPWVQNYYTSSGNYDYAGVNGLAIDRLQMKLRGLDGYSIKYRVHLKGGDWLPYVYDDGDYAGIRGRIIDAVEVEII